MTLVPAVIIAIAVLILGISAFFAWVLWYQDDSSKLPPFNPIPPTTVVLAGVGKLLVPIRVTYSSTVFTDEYPGTDTTMYLDFIIIPNENINGLTSTYDLKSILGNNTGIFSDFEFEVDIKPYQVYYLTETDSGTVRNIVNITDNTFVRPGYKYIASITTAVAPNQVNYSTAYDSATYSYVVYSSEDLTNGQGSSQGTNIESPNESREFRNIPGIRERLLSVFNRDTETIRNNNYQDITLNVSFFARPDQLESIERFNNEGFVLRGSGRLEYVASTPCA